MAETRRRLLAKSSLTTTATTIGASATITTTGATTVASLVEHSARTLSHLHDEWRTTSLADVRENLLYLAIILSAADGEDKNTLLTSIQKGLFWILQKHYISYRKENHSAFNEFNEKFNLLLETLTITFPIKVYAEETRERPFDDNGDDGEQVEVLVHMLQGVLNRHRGLFSFTLQCMKKLPLSVEARTNVLQSMALPHLSRLSHSDSPVRPLLAMIGELPSDDIESVQTISVVRNLWIKLETKQDGVGISRHLMGMAQEVIRWFSSEWNGHFLATAYLQAIDEWSNDSSGREPSIPLLDLIVLLTLSVDEDFVVQSSRIIDSWVNVASFFGSMQRLLRSLNETKAADNRMERLDIARELASPLIIFAIRMLRSVDLIKTQEVHDFCLSLFEFQLEEYDRRGFANAIIRIWYELACLEKFEYLNCLHQVIQSLSEKSPETMRGARHLFIEIIESRPIKDVSVSQHICAIAARLFCEHEEDELFGVVDRLLFSTVDCGDYRVVHGIVLATESIRFRGNTTRKITALRTRVLQVILPSDRRALPPVLGSPGLSFLKCSGDSSESIYRGIQEILANTGLIQRFSAYKQTKRKYYLTLGFCTETVGQSPSRDESFIFCAAFFLRHSNCEDLDQWGSIISWVYDMVNSYLEHGRERSSTSWNPQGWLEAVIEFPGLRFPFQSRGPQQKSCADWILRDCGTFEAGASTICSPPANFRSVCIDMFLRDASHLDSFRAILFRFALGILVGASLSAAVLANAFVHYKGCTDESRKYALLRMIEGQMMKVHSLREKVNALEHVILGPLETALRKLETLPSPTRASHARCEPLGDKLPSNSVAKLKEELAVLGQKFFCTTAFISEDILWETLTEEGGNDILMNHLRNLVSPDASTDAAAKIYNSEVATVLESKSRLASQLIAGRISNVEVPHSHIEKQAFFTVFLVGMIPQLRGTLSDMDTPPLDSWLDFAAVSIQLLSLWLSQAAAQSYDFTFVLKALRRSFESSAPDDKTELRHAVDGLRRILVASDDAQLSNGILEILSIVGTRVATSDSCLKVMKASWGALRKSYSNSCMVTNCSELPFSAMTLRTRFKAPSRTFSILKRALDTTVFRGTGPRNRGFDSFSVHRYSLVRHFGLLALYRRTTDSMERFLQALANELESFLDRSARKTNTNSTKKVSKSIRPRTKYVSSFVSLTENSFADFFEVLLHMIIGAAALFQPTIAPKKVGSHQSPYRTFQQLLQLFRRVILLYSNNFVHFPRKSVAVCYASARTMMEVISGQVGRCVDWRSSQILPKANTSHDPGSLAYLTELVQHSCENIVADAINLVSEMWEADKTTQIAAKGKSLRICLERYTQILQEAIPANNHASGIACQQNKRRRIVPLNVQSPQGKDVDNSVDPDDDDEFALSSDSDDDEGFDGNSNDETFAAAGAWGSREKMDDDSIDSVPEIPIHRAS